VLGRRQVCSQPLAPFLPRLCLRHLRGGLPHPQHLFPILALPPVTIAASTNELAVAVAAAIVAVVVVAASLFIPFEFVKSSTSLRPRSPRVATDVRGLRSTWPPRGPTDAT